MGFGNIKSFSLQDSKFALSSMFDMLVHAILIVE